MRIRLPKTPFQISLTLHGSVLLLLIFGSLFQGCREPEDEFVFEMVALPSFELPSQPTQASTQPEVVTTPEREPTFSPIEPLHNRPVIEASTQEQLPARPESSPEIPREVPQAAPERPKAMSIEEFRKLHGNPQTPSRPQPQRQPTRIDVPAINTSQITESLQQAANQSISPPASSSMAAEMDAYNSRLRNLINGLWNPDPSLPAQDLVAEVEFWYDANGRITRYRFIRRSGLPSFDQSVDRVFQNLQSVPAPPNRKAGSRTIPFRVGL